MCQNKTLAVLKISGMFHSILACNLSTRCVKSAGAHKSRDCEKNLDTPCRCPHCGGDNLMNYQSCSKFDKNKSLVKLKKLKVQSANSKIILKANSNWTFLSTKVSVLILHGSCKYTKLKLCFFLALKIPIGRCQFRMLFQLSTS